MAYETPDFLLYPDGSMVLFRPMNDAARRWFDGHFAIEPWQRMGTSIGIETRIAHDVIMEIDAAGYTLRDTGA